MFGNRYTPEKQKGEANYKRKETIEDLKNIAYEATGGPAKLEFSDEIVGMTKWFDGTVLDIIKKVKE